MQPTDIPVTFAAKIEYEEFYTGKLTEENEFGNDPIGDNEDLYNERSRQFFQQFNVATIFKDCLRNNSETLKNAIYFVIGKTQELM